jgi:hydrogenase expression/formation protein HypE
MGTNKVQCPVPHGDESRILLAHGGGGRLMRNLVERLIVPAFSNPILDQKHDSGVVPMVGQQLAMTTDSYVVSPLFFPGGDIGTLSVFGTCNDLAMAGAQPQYLSVSFILEEGLLISTLNRVVSSMKEACKQSGVTVITGDTKVVERGKADGMFVTTTGIGRIVTQQSIQPDSIQAGDKIILSGDLGRHGIAVLSQREGMVFEACVESDCAPLWPAVSALLAAPISVHCLRDLTRGGLATALCELAQDTQLGMVLDESLLEVRDEVRGACELLGLDPWYVANEGRFVCVVPEHEAQRACHVLQAVPVANRAKVIGTVTQRAAGNVLLQTPFGGERVLDMLAGEQLPRICLPIRIANPAVVLEPRFVQT